MILCALKTEYGIRSVSSLRFLWQQFSSIYYQSTMRKKEDLDKVVGLPPKNTLKKFFHGVVEIFHPCGAEWMTFSPPLQCVEKCMQPVDKIDKTHQFTQKQTFTVLISRIAMKKSIRILRIPKEMNFLPHDCSCEKSWHLRGHARNYIHYPLDLGT